MKTFVAYVRTIIILIVALIVFNSLKYEVNENEYALVKRFGKVIDIEDTAGIKFKAPFIDSVTKVTKAKQFYDIAESSVITSDKKSMEVNAYVIWRVTSPKDYYSKLQNSTNAAQARIDTIVYNAIKTVIPSMTQDELIAARDNAIEVTADGSLDDLETNDYEEEEESNDVEVIAVTSLLQDYIGNQLDEYGIEITSVRIKVLDLPSENKEAVYTRMITERNNIAAAYTAQGDAEKQMIINATDAEVAVTVSEAEAKAEQIIAEGEAEYMRILSDAYNDSDKADFYTFTLALDAAKDSLENGNTTLFLDSNSPIAQIFNGMY